MNLPGIKALPVEGHAEATSTVSSASPAASRCSWGCWLLLVLAPLRRDLAVTGARWIVAVLCGGYAVLLIHARC